ncbi:hypothetical protein FHX57_007779 [Paraburkholderia tropica]|uniref:hypothetical protein n=1 Tax=Paraburkholderia tropica TaxID=92647 RepID=UPI000F5591C0|nr:hypothetical protein [Paraburkholderia tropica]MBB3005382.1 hypothetical protein [Paraburkholderia tropica]MBB6324379.1 hypothetical protein [Paraburkholderia tropica]RQN34321.1 hypothetical protein EHZ25_35290 [Paraburkholderia tropica]
MIPNSLRDFISRLREATEKDEVSWVEADGTAYFCDHKDVTLHISPHFDHDREQSSFHFRISKGPKNTPFSVYDIEDDYLTMKALYEAVIANANDVGNDVKGFFD